MRNLFLTILISVVPTLSFAHFPMDIFECTDQIDGKDVHVNAYHQLGEIFVVENYGQEALAVIKGLKVNYLKANICGNGVITEFLDSQDRLVLSVKPTCDPGVYKATRLYSQDHVYSVTCLKPY